MKLSDFIEEKVQSDPEFNTLYQQELTKLDQELEQLKSRKSVHELVGIVKVSHNGTKTVARVKPHRSRRYRTLLENHIIAHKPVMIDVNGVKAMVIQTGNKNIKTDVSKIRSKSENKVDQELPVRYKMT